MIRTALLAATLAATPALAQPVVQSPYDALAPLLHGAITFDDLPALPEPGHDLQHGYATASARVGERFAGQRLISVPDPTGGRHDGLDGEAQTPLAIETGAPGEGLSMSWHRAFRSNAVYPLGPARWPVPEARGEGALAILFAEDVCAVALRLHTEYVDALGSNSGHRGEATVTLLSRDGGEIAQIRLMPGGGITGYGFARPSHVADIAGLTVTNRDKGGIALDDIRFGCVPVTG